MFVGRNEELRILKDRYSSNKTEMISVLGRRRVGKSQLLFESYQDFDGIVFHYECFDTGYLDNLNKITNKIKKIFDNEYLSFNSLYDVILFLYKESKRQKILFVLDEYPYMRTGKETDSEIKNAIDKINETDDTVLFKFILCGSAVQVMEILDDVNMPLHGRFNQIIRLEPLNYLYSSLFFENVSNEDKVGYYSLLGGVPYYLKQINPNLSFKENIINLFFSSHPLLKTELENQINGEINKVENAHFILNVIREKMISYTDLLQKFNTSFPNKDIDYSLKKLLKMKVVTKITVEQDNGKKKPYYIIKDNSLVFYYSFLLESSGNKLLFTDEEYYQTFIEEKLLKEFIPHAFEKIGNEFVALMNKKHKFDFLLLDLFPYIVNDKTAKTNFQFDVVGKTADGLINFECKYQHEPISLKKVYQEERQAELANKHFIQTIFISNSEVLGANSYYNLKDIFDKTLL